MCVVWQEAGQDSRTLARGGQSKPSGSHFHFGFHLKIKTTQGPRRPRGCRGTHPPTEKDLFLSPPSVQWARWIRCRIQMLPLSVSQQRVLSGPVLVLAPTSCSTSISISVYLCLSPSISSSLSPPPFVSCFLLLCKPGLVHSLKSLMELSLCLCSEMEITSIPS